MIKKILLISLILIVSCSFLQQQNQTETKPTKETTSPKEETPAEVVVVVSCEQVDNTDYKNRAKATLTYSNGQKESFRQMSRGG